MLNFKCRIRQKWFWLTLIPLLFLLADQVAQLVATVAATTAGQLYGSETMDTVLAVVGTAFAVLALIGFPVDMTTEGYGDSDRAMTYDAPAEKDKYGYSE